MHATPEYPRKYALSRADYHRMAQAGVFPPDARVELIEGEIIEMSLINPPHLGVVNLLTERLLETFSGSAIVQVQNPVGMGSHSEPQPDFSVLRYREDRYRGKAPEAEDVILNIEVSDSTYRYDLNTKLPLYAKHRIPTVWIVDIQHSALYVYQQLDDTGYDQIDKITAFESLELLVEGRYPVRLDGLF